MRSLTTRRCVALGLLGLLLVICLRHEPAGVTALVATSTRHTALYKDLGVAAGASKEEIKKAFRAFTRQHHPDLKETFQEKEDAKAAMAKVLRAYEVLSDDKKKAAYDESGIIPGEAPNLEEMTANELFEYYHQSSPIFSKSPTLKSLTQLRRLQEFRGGRVFLIQVYDDTQCKNCRYYSAAWEMLYQSSLVEAGVLEMYRIDALSEEGSPLLAHLGIRYRKEPYVLAIVDGEAWTLYSIAEAMKQRNHNRAFHSLLEFVMSFFYDVFQQTRSLEVTQLEDILTFLRAPRSVKQPLRALLPTINAESIPVALQMRYNQVEVRSVPREFLLEFVEEYCEMEIGVKDRFGESVPMAEFIVVSTEALPMPPKDVTETSDTAALEAETEASTPQKSCRLVHIGAAVALTYRKASRFMEDHLPERHVGMKGLRYAGATDFLQVCRDNCVVWMREDCAEAPDAHVAALMANDYLSFKTGYWCMEEERRLAEVLSKAGVWTATSKSMAASPSALVAFVGGNDSVTYQLVSLQAKAPEELTAQDIYTALSTLVGNAEESEDGSEAARVAAPIPSHLPQPVASLLATDGFPISRKQRLYIQAMTIYTFAAPLVSSSWPFFMMYLVHRFVLNRNKPEAEEEARKKREESAAAAANGVSSANEASAAPVRRRIRKPQPRVGPYNPRDMKWAKEEKGFLLLLVEDGLAAGALPLPRLALDEPFTVRVLGTGQGKWRQWILEHKPAAPEGAAEKLPEAERQISLMAIRKTRMKALVKSDAQTIDAFLRDLLDGTKNPSEELPSWAYDE
ncbi:DNAJ domain protein, putative [Leishmania donovani]|uniref:DNAJ domain protein, putative n=1 Tax=Leishmania donovani TaxID=5661 RepID=E9BGR5_LEIDO|nr:DNAJ domain protein, putative [Leishmania donovani]TPP52191.1 DnaJ domain family protein [Leishmania donovani]CBZ34441.1 DNAJ domain protein, putative [Leishmania donovani]